MSSGPRLRVVRLFVVMALWAAPAAAAEHYVDCAAGSDRADGRSPGTAWLTLAPANAARLLPGDSLRIKRGTRCSGHLRPRGSGEPGRPITIGAYGSGPLPVIDAAGEEAAITLFDQEHWEIETVEVVGGNPYGIHISGSAGTLRHFRLRNVVVHGVRGEPKTKASGLVVIAASGDGQTFEDIVVDGVTAYDSTQWAGIVVKGASDRGPAGRARRVVVRNSIVHDVFGDGIVLFEVEDGLIEKSAAWRTGLQPVETIGTPNGIWTWRCRRCRVEWTEGFFIDSPGVDGGVYDIDWGCEDNVVQRNYGHDSMGYCASVFGAMGEVTSNSIVRDNVCIGNGRSPKLARRQGDLFITTWDGGKLDGIQVTGNTFYWSPPIDAPLVHAEDVAFIGSRPNVIADNTLRSRSASLVRSGSGLRFERNRYYSSRASEPRWQYGGREWVGFEAYSRGTGQDLSGSWVRSRDGAERAPAGPRGPWTLVSDLADDAESRAQVVFLQAVLEQYGGVGLSVVVRFDARNVVDLRHDWDLGGIRAEASTTPRGPLPRTALLAADATVVRRWDGFATPSELGLALRALLGPPTRDPELTETRGR